ncbi:hypothetical protein XA68_16013 [Ophiocordyceps unilateralis]|uniref:Gamma-glutamyltransferase n=1 Tax=Ophiocordyceps unilateralis TaxID=268505 RepID=A0A2A9PK60_OPHUN|nr:hypothetical protein XA68_16013 [Ophiocordyceps unilateralis]
MTPYPVRWVVRLLAASELLRTVVGASNEEAKLGAVACESAVCSRIGTQLLQSGGSAADAMVGTVLCVGTVAMYHSGIGGGGFMTIRAADGQYETVDFREMAPAAAFEDMYKNKTDASIIGGLARKYGKLDWARVLEPAIHLARYGFVVTEDLVRQMDSASDPLPFLTDDAAWAVDFAPGGRRVQLGEVMTRKRYADTLETVAKQGVEAFYSGPMAQATIAALRSRNGTMTMADLANYTLVHRQPVHIDYHGVRLTSCNAPSGGIVALSALNILSNYDHLGDGAQFNLTTHRMDEAIKFAYGQRTKLGDPSFVDVANLTAAMVSAEHGAHLRTRISDVTTQHLPWYDPDGFESIDTPGTSHLVAADASGLAISLTTTVNLIFGSRVMVPETGVVMNNQMNDFSIPGVSNGFGYIPSPSNYIRPGKRPLSSISPIIAETADGKLLFSIGAAGGSRITTATIQNTIHLLDRHMSMVETLRQPRLHDQLVPTVVTFEYTFNNDTVAFMKSLRHNVTWVAPGQSAAQGLRLLPNGTFEAAGEPRQMASGGFAV